MADLRIGQGVDVHRLVQGRPLIIGGVNIPHDRGLEGYSDADVLLHAIADALLGAAGLPDIGQQFPNTDEKYRDADSMNLLAAVKEKVSRAGYPMIVNIDATIIAEQPPLNPHIPAMKRNIADILGMEASRVGIKATTSESMGYIGRGEGIAATAVCLISNHD